MRILALCCTLVLLAGCDTIGGRTVTLKLQHQQSWPRDNISVEQALLIVDKAMAPEGITRSVDPSNENGRVAGYTGGSFTCSAIVRDGKLAVRFSNHHIGAGPDPEIIRVSHSVAEALKAQYGPEQVKIK